MKFIKFKKLLKKELLNPKFLKEYISLENEFKAIDDKIKKRIKPLKS